MKEATCSQKTPPRRVFFVGAVPPVARGLGGPLEPVEHSEPDERHQVDVVLEEREALTYRFAYGLLLLGEIGQEVDEDVGYRDAAGHREPYASGGALQEAHTAGQEVNYGQDDHREERDEDEGVHRLLTCPVG